MAKKVKVKPIKPSPMRGKKGRFIAKAKVTGKASMKTFFDVIRDSPLEIARSEVKELAEAAADAIRRGIAYQNIPPMGGRKFGLSRRFDQPLHPFTVEQKEKNNQDSRTLIATGFYVNHIGVVEQKKGKGWSYRVGLTAKQHPSGIPLAKLVVSWSTVRGSKSPRRCDGTSCPLRNRPRSSSRRSH